MSEEHTADEPFITDDSTDTVDRRRFIKALGVTGSATAFGVTGAGYTSAQAPQRQKPTIKQVDEAEKDRLVRKTSNTKEINKIVEYLESEEDLLLDESGIEAHTVTDPSEPIPTGESTDEVLARNSSHEQDRRVISFPMNSTETEESSTAGVAASLYQNQVQSVVASKTKKIDESTHEVTIYNISDNEVRKNTISVDTDLTAINRESIATQNSIGCDACFWAGNIVCSLGCGLPISYICLLAGFGTVGSLGCSTFVTLFCGAIIFINENIQGHACQDDRYIELACERIGAGNCTD